MTKHHGSCHCGAVRYTVDADLEGATACNCSMCGRAGTLLAFVPESSFALEAGDDATGDYQFGAKHIHHLFCRTCGIKPYAWGLDEKGQRTIAVNLRCLEDFDLEKLPVTHFDGAAL